ncbi:MAG: flagellar basal body-associated FliL family protein [Pseudomonadota bacterium]|uniref:flagellar basal body-associated FliL family protein n=1 Tax=Sulfuricystis thermophila TaxID=2496847 RepID=UPI0010364E42|nr:flagellar basal body-associated FliL family protein [Sulfuricystis thermophila]MDI6750632.1 flagellar basal body-associated FliL family protein [Rhodocyclaceae bacterium]
MAEAKKTETPAEGEVPKKKSKLLLIILIAVLVLVLGGGGAAFFLMKKKAADEEGADEGDEPPAKTAKAKKKKKDDHAMPPVFSKLDPFVVKLQAEQQEAYVQAVPELKLADAHVADQIKNFMPEIRHKVLLILAGKKAAELSTPEGMQILANQIRESINATLTGERPDPAKEKMDTNEEGPVIAVFFSSLIVQ